MDSLSYLPKISSIIVLNNIPPDDLNHKSDCNVRLPQLKKKEAFDEFLKELMVCFPQ